MLRRDSFACFFLLTNFAHNKFQATPNRILIPGTAQVGYTAPLVQIATNSETFKPKRGFVGR